MKKVLFLAALAVAFMACENKNEMPKGEQKAMDAATAQVVKQIGKADPAAVDKTLTDAGFVKMTDNDLTAGVKARAKAKLPKAVKDEGEVEIQYVYGLPKNWQEMTEDELEKYMMDELAKGNGYIMVTVVYSDDILYMTSTTLLTAIRDEVNVSYTKESDKLYAAMPDAIENGAYFQGLTMLGEEQTKYEDHAEYVAAVAAAKGIAAQEVAYRVTSYTAAGYTGTAYQAMWMNPNEEQQKTMEEDMGVVCAYGMFVVADINAMME